MAATKWTPAQKTAIDDRGGTLLVSAAAGSGKTAVLTERVVELLQDAQHPIAADRLLIVTFTNASAAELRARIATRIEQVLQEQPNNQHLRRQKMMISRAHISTVDAFCIDLLHHHFSALDIPPDFAAADAGVLEHMRQEAIAQTLEAAYQDAAFCDFANLYGRGRTDGAARSAILQIYNYLRALPFEDEAVAQLLAPWQTEQGQVQASWQNTIVQRIYTLACVAGLLAKEALSLCEDDCETEKADKIAGKKTERAQLTAARKVEEKYAIAYGCLDDLYAACVNVRTMLHDAKGWDALYAAFEPYRTGQTPIPGLKGTGIRLSGEHKGYIKREADLASDLFADIVELLVCDGAQAEQDRVMAQPMLEALMRAVADFSARFYAKKLEKKMFDFSDFEHLTLKLLQEDPVTHQRTALAARISAEFDVIMVDEYQDTNALQEAIYRRLANENGDNLFFVGDLKQSIYRFRQADPSIFAYKQTHFDHLAPDAPRAAPPKGVAGRDAVLALDANFRSSPAVVDGVNFVFEQLMSASLGGTEYGDGQRLVCKGGDTLNGTVGLLLDKVGGEEPLRVALKIQELVARGAKGEAVGMVRDGGVLRPVRYEDCCILLSTRMPFAKYTKALAGVGIPTYADSADDLLKESHIRPLVALVQIIDNPAQDLPLAAVMLSVLCGFTEDDLVALRLRRRKGSLYGAVIAIAAAVREAQAQGTSVDVFEEKVALFYEQLSAWRRLSHVVAPEELLAEIFAQTHYLALVGAMENGARRREELSRFVAFVARAGGNGIEQLVRNIEATAASGGLVDSAMSHAKPGCVTIMTIHRSKGLQFPVVFAANLEHVFNTDELKNKLMLHSEEGLGLQLRAGEEGNNYQTLASNALRLRLRQDMLSESLRLLYVALTRAQDHVYMSASITTLEKRLNEMALLCDAGASALLHTRARSFLDWVLAALLKHPSCGVLRAACDGVHIAQANGSIHVEEYEESIALIEEDTQKGELTAVPERALVEQLKEGFAWEYEHAALTELPAKVSVTSLVHQSQSALLDRPAFLAKDGMSAAEKGTALHAFLENADFDALRIARERGADALRDALRAETARQVAARQLLPERAEELSACGNFAHLEAFFMGEAFARVCAARQYHREYAFITGVPAHEVLAASGQSNVTARGAQSDATVLVQGIADLLLVYDDHLELLDYKSDRGKTASALRAAYEKQLAYYATAIEKRFAPLKITYRAIYAFALDALVEA